jgi:hypothetical protein
LEIIRNKVLAHLKLDDSDQTVPAEENPFADSWEDIADEEIPTHYRKMYGIPVLSSGSGDVEFSQTDDNKFTGLQKDDDGLKDKDISDSSEGEGDLAHEVT